MKYLNLKKELLRYGITQSELAKILNTGIPNLSCKFHGKAEWKLDEINKVLDLLNNQYNANVTYEYLFKKEK